MDQSRLRTNDGYARISYVAWRLMQRRVAVQMVILATVVLTYSAAHALTPTDGIQGVYSAQDRQSETSLYAILQQLPPPPGDMPVPPAWRNGVLLRVLVTAGPSGVETSTRRQPSDVPCRQCTAQHFFLLPSQLSIGAHQKLRALRHPPGGVTYLDVKGREYALFHIHVRRTEKGLRLLGAELMRTGFVPPVLKKRLRLRFDAPLATGARWDRIVAAALADARESTPDIALEEGKADER